ncbi:glycosyltransferase [Paracidovorax wautersii]|uniref:Glycosyltransferase involved in cell wall bisynthesis n=1 Tax=Paracidovorax wautersii TaxID=1177982 RepID=A0A1I2CLP4_9BURK|nr:glycosyltransferase [Paracidovorax wautersii]SFE68650.1 Glycosyltransferase involved in cell wall bisynthesis [Paracidovorax wautersii]
MVRFANYLEQCGTRFICVCSENGYAHKDLQRHKIPASSILPISCAPDYYYKTKAKRKKLVEIIATAVGHHPARLVTFCMRDLFTATALAAKLPVASITHLILHIQDDLYAGQTLAEKLIYRLTGKLSFGNSKLICFNRSLLTMLNKNDGLICMADLIAHNWQRNFGISIPSDHIVPLPSFVPPAEGRKAKETDKRILWIGRLVDFKIPALLALIDFLAHADGYKATIVGGGDRSHILARMKECRVATDRVDFIGEVSYDGLEDVIRTHSIGYAMGTSLIELARFKIPVIVALASYTHNPYQRPICGGLFFNQPRGCDGSELAGRRESEIVTEISDAVALIEADWSKTANACYEYARENYSADKNFSKYRIIIEQSKYFSAAQKTVYVPKAPLSRRMIFSLVNWWQKCIRHH